MDADGVWRLRSQDAMDPGLTAISAISGGGWFRFEVGVRGISQGLVDGPARTEEPLTIDEIGRQLAAILNASGHHRLAVQVQAAAAHVEN
jgi:hypothetical protein